MTASEVGALVAFLSALYPSWRPPENTVAAWSMMLGSADPAAAQRAAKRHAASGKWPPSVAELLSAMGDEARPLPTPDEALREVLDAVQSTPWGEQPEGLSPLGAAVVDSLGFRYIQESDNPSTLRAQILRVAEARRDALRRDNAEALAGLPAASGRTALESGFERDARVRALNESGRTVA